MTITPRLAQAIAEIGRIEKTVHVLRYLDDESMRRDTLVQLNRGEGRHGLSRVVFHGPANGTARARKTNSARSASSST